MVFHGPNRSGRSRHGKPVFAMKTTAFKKCRFDNSAGRPGRSRSGGSRCLIRTQSTAVSSCRRITTVDHETIFPSIPQRQAITVLRDFPANPTSGCPSLRTRPSTADVGLRMARGATVGIERGSEAMPVLSRDTAGDGVYFLEGLPNCIEEGGLLGVERRKCSSGARSSGTRTRIHLRLRALRQAEQQAK